MRFNIWNGGNNFPPANNASQNQNYFLDVDWVKVTKVAPVSTSVTEVGGVAVSPSGVTTVPNLSVVKGQVTGTASMVNVVIRRLSDGAKWNGSSWVPGSQNVGTSTNYPSTQPDWTTNGALPSGANLAAGAYEIYADALSNGNYISSPIVTVRINSNAIPVSQSFGPTSGSTNVGTARASNAIYSDADGFTDIAECAIELRQGGTATTAFYNRVQNKLYLSDGNGGRVGGFAPGSSNFINNSFVTLNCANTDIFTSVANKQVQVRWNFTPKAPLAGNNQVNLDVTDASGAYAGFVNKATWTVIGAPAGNSAPVTVGFGPNNSNSQVGNTYRTNAIYADADGTNDLGNLSVAIIQGGIETRVYYNSTLNRLYLLNDAKTAWMGGVAPGSPNQLANNLISVDCSQTNVFRTTDARNQIQVRWFFTANAGLIGNNDIYLQAFDASGATSGFNNKATWTVYTNGSQRSSNASSEMEANSTSVDSFDSGKQSYSDENPYVGESVADPRTIKYPTKKTGDGTEGPPIDPIPRTESPSSASASSALTQEASPAPSGQQS